MTPGALLAALYIAKKYSAMGFPRLSVTATGVPSIKTVSTGSSPRDGDVIIGPGHNSSNALGSGFLPPSAGVPLVFATNVGIPVDALWASEDEALESAIDPPPLCSIPM